MFQDEARFGRMSDPRACWAPAPHRPVVNLALIREYKPSENGFQFYHLDNELSVRHMNV